MKTTSETYKTLFESGAVQEYRITVGGVAYDSEAIYDKTEITKNLFDKQTFTIGAFTIDTLKVKLNIPSEDIERRANVEFEYRYVGDTPSEWISFFKGKVSKRTKYTDDVTTIEVHTVAANYDTAIDVLIVSEYPANARTVTTQLATHLGLEVDNIEDIIDLNIVEYPNEMTVVEVLQEVAKNSGGNWAIVGDKLRLVVGNGGVVGEYGAQSITTGTIFNPITKIRMYYDDESAFEYGDDSGSTLEIDSKFATPETVEYVHGLLNGYEYVPVNAQGVYIDPAIERGDIIIVDNQEALVANTKWTFDGLVTADIETPLDNEDNYDEPYNTLIQQQFKRKVSLGDSYQGVTIDRQKGLETLLSPTGKEDEALGKAYFDLHRGMAFQYRDTPRETWKDWLYFDKDEKIFKLSLYDTSEELGDRFSDIEISLDEIAGKVEGVSFGSILINHNGEDDTYDFWEDFVTSDPLEFNTGMTFRTGMTNYTIFEPIEDSNTLSNSKISFFANGSTENGPFTVVKDYKYGFRIRRVNGNQHFSIEVREYNSNKEYIQKQTFVFNNVQSYHDISSIELGTSTEYVGLRYIVSGVSWSNRLELAEGMFGIGAPKPYVENVDGLRAWAQSQFQLQQNQIDLKVATKDFTGDRMVSLISVQPANVKIASKNLDLEGLVKFTNLTDASTIISGDNVKTGTINANLVSVTNLNATNITSGTLSAVRIPNLDASKITTGQLSASRINFNGATGSNVNLTGTITATSGKIGNMSLTSGRLRYTTSTYSREYTRADLSAIREIIMTGRSPNAYERYIYDVNGDGLVSSLDYMRIKNYLYGSASKPKNPQIQSQIDVGDTNGRFVSRVLYNNGTVGLTSVIQADMANLGAVDVTGLSIRGKSVEVDSNGFLKLV